MFVPRMLREIAAENAADAEAADLRDRLLELLDHDPMVKAAIKRHTAPPAPATPRGGGRRG